MSGPSAIDHQVGSYTVRESDYGLDFEKFGYERTKGCFCYVLRGHCVETQNGRAYEMPTAALVYHPLGHVRSFIGKNLRCVSLHFDLTRLSTLLDGRLPFDRKLVIHGGDAVSIGTRLAREVSQFDAYSPWAIEGLLYDMAVLSARQNAFQERQPAPSWLAKARDLVRDPAASHLTLATIAKEVGAHPVHLSRTFQRHYGLSMSDYGRQVRLQRACLQLADANIEISDIAFEAGFADHSQFSRHFKRATGITPTEYRRLTR